MRKRILHINSMNYGSTGSIILNLSKISEKYGYDSTIAFPAARSNLRKEISNKLIIGNRIERNIHLKLAYYTGLNGCFSTQGTKIFLKKVSKLKPDIIHLHNLHNSYINLKLLFDYIKKNNIPVVWTLHDCWPFTGKCPHFTMVDCEKWKNGCYECPQLREYPASKIDNTKIMYEKKKEWFTGVDNLVIVTPSRWLKEKVKKSFLKNYKVKVINNGIDLNIFKPTKSSFKEKFRVEDKTILLGVANIWTKSKGLNTFINLSNELDEQYKIVLVGISEKQKKELPKRILSIQRTFNIQELVEIYSAADYFINPSIEETMGLVTVESLACGTPAIVSNSTAVPEMVNEDVGIVVEQNDYKNFLNAINNNKKRFDKKLCIEWAKNFDVDDKVIDYIKLYKDLL